MTLFPQIRKCHTLPFSLDMQCLTPCINAKQQNHNYFTCIISLIVFLVFFCALLSSSSTITESCSICSGCKTDIVAIKSCQLELCQQITCACVMCGHILFVLVVQFVLHCPFSVYNLLLICLPKQEAIHSCKSFSCHAESVPCVFNACTHRQFTLRSQLLFSKEFTI